MLLLNIFGAQCILVCKQDLIKWTVKIWSKDAQGNVRDSIGKLEGLAKRY